MQGEAHLMKNPGSRLEQLGASWVAQTQAFEAGDRHPGTYFAVEDLKSTGYIFVTLG